MFDKIKTFFGLSEPQTEEDKIFGVNEAISAKSAYMHTKYGQDQSQKELLKAFFKDAYDLIRSKTLKNAYCCMLEIDEDIIDFLPNIVNRFQNELGYNVVTISNDTEIKQDDKVVQIKPDSTFIIIMWNKANIKDTTSILTGPNVEKLPEKQYPENLEE